MKLQNILIMCSSAFQIIAATRIRQSLLIDETVDLLITDQLANCELIRNRISKTKLFDNVYIFKIKDYNWKNWKHTWFGYVYNIQIICRFSEVQEKHYKSFFFANISSGSASSCLATFLKERDHTELCMFEDGFASYSPLYKREFDKVFYNHSFRQSLIYGLKKPGYYYIDKYYVSEPDILNGWKYPFSIAKIPQLSEDAVKALNDIFDYANCKDKYEEQYIFFEESYYADGKDVGDVEIVRKVADIVGKDKIIIKIHPRNPHNRFSELGFKTNLDTSVPWEIIALNIDIEDKTLITIASGSSITSYFVSNKKAKKSILLYEFRDIDKNQLTSTIPVFDEICKGNKYFCFPKNWDELKKLL